MRPLMARVDAAIEAAAMVVAAPQKRVQRRRLRVRRRFGLRVLVKGAGIVEIAAVETGIVTVGIVVAGTAGSVSLRVNLWPLRFRPRMRALAMHLARAMRLVKALRARMVRAGGVDAGDVVVVVAAAMSCRKARRRRAMDLRLR